MGCCLSSSSSKSSSPPKPANRYDFEPQKFLKSTAESRAPPPDPEEETVKEVLSSETPNPRPPTQPQPHCSPPAPNPQPEPIEKKEIPEAEPPPLPRPQPVEKLVAAEEEISEQDASEVCSVSVSVSMSESAMSTATTANDGEEVVMKRKEGSRRSPAGKVSAARINRAFSAADSGARREQRVVGRSPTRRSDRSPVKRNYSGGGGGGGGGQVRMVQQSRESGYNPGARRPLRPDPSRRDPGDSSERRSRSPAMQRSAAAAGSRNGSVKRANQSPGRVMKDPPEISGKEAKPGNGVPGQNRNNKNDDVEEEDATAANESLENPLVSLECFIFL